jgi:hypothetical protein
LELATAMAWASPSAWETVSASGLWKPRPTKCPNCC